MEKSPIRVVANRPAGGVRAVGYAAVVLPAATAARVC
ncbi:hypothetical protein QO003_003692 [Arthrobacter silviterrae]|nr:hypothetical protein [Arthrobacter silviterrae]